MVRRRSGGKNPGAMTVQLLFALALTVASACLINWGYLREHAAASALPPLTPRRPLVSLRALLGSGRWLVGFGAESLGFGLYVVAVALAPLALVQAVAAGGIGVLALLVARTTGSGLARRERLGVAVAIGGLVLLAVSLAGGSEEGNAGAWLGIAMWLGASVAAAAIAVGWGATWLGGGAAFGAAAGILFAAGDVATKVMVGGGDHLAIAPAMVVFYAGGTVVLQLGFQRGRALTTAGIATLGTNAIPIAAAMTLFAEPLPRGAMGLVRLAAFAAVVIGAVALAPRHQAATPADTDRRVPTGATREGRRSYVEAADLRGR
jgi:hypothetical protein